MSETKLPRMTAAEAQHFERYSVQNAATVNQALICGCEPYKDVFTFNRWIAQGYAVQRGQKAIKISTITEKVDEETGETKRLSPLFSAATRSRRLARRETTMTNPTTSSQPDQSKILERIRRLLALSSSSNEYEAAAAAAKAQELLLRHNLDRRELESERDDDIDRADFDSGYKAGWLDSLIAGISSATLCRVIRDNLHGKTTRYHVFGKPANIEVVEYLWGYLAGEIERLVPRGNGRAYMNAWRLGAVSTISRRLKDELNHFQAAAPESYALVVASDKAVEARMKRDFPETRSSRRVSVTDYSGYRAGQAAGANIPIHQGVRQSNAAGQRLLK